jgi:hypothetical protein
VPFGRTKLLRRRIALGNRTRRLQPKPPVAFDR